MINFGTNSQNTNTTGTSYDMNQYDPDREYMQQLYANEMYGPEGVTGSYFNYNSPYQAAPYADYGPTFSFADQPGGPYDANGNYGFMAPQGGVGSGGGGSPYGFGGFYGSMPDPSGGYGGNDAYIPPGGLTPEGSGPGAGSPGPGGSSVTGGYSADYAPAGMIDGPGGQTPFGEQYTGTPSEIYQGTGGGGPSNPNNPGGGQPDPNAPLGPPGNPGAPGVVRVPNTNPTGGQNHEIFPNGSMTYPNQPMFTNGPPGNGYSGPIVYGPMVTPANGARGAQFAGPFTQWNQGGASGNRQLAGAQLYGNYSDLVNHPDLPDSVKSAITEGSHEGINSSYGSAEGQIARNAGATNNQSGVPAAMTELALDKGNAIGNADRQNLIDFENFREQRQNQGLQGLGGLYQGEGNYMTSLMGQRGSLDNGPIGRNSTTQGTGNFVGSNFGMNLSL